jgi:type IV secretory pathway TraG/TraD family ATPase VirD4
MTRPTNAPKHGMRPPIVSAMYGIGAYIIMQHLPPLVEGYHIAVSTAFMLVLCCVFFMSVAVWCCQAIATGCEWLCAITPRHNKGTAKWAAWRSLKKDIKRYGWSPYWGYLQPHWWSIKRLLFVDYESCAMTAGISGSGKGVCVVQPSAMAVHHSKIFMDLKGNYDSLLREPLTARGEVFHALNIGGLSHIKDQSSYNPCDILNDDLMNPHGGLADFISDAEEFAAHLHPQSHKDIEGYWKIGAQDLISTAIIQCSLVNGQDTNLFLAHQLLLDRASYLHDMQWVAGQLEDKDGNSMPAMPLEQSPLLAHHSEQDRNHFIDFYRAKAKSVADMLSAKDNKSAEAFIAGARQAMRHFRIGSHAHKVMSRSTFRFKDLKEHNNRPVNVAIVVDATRLSSQQSIASLVQSCALIELRRSNGKNPVYIYADECTTFRIHDLQKLMTYGREYLIRLHLIFQSIAAFRAAYGQDAVGTLLSETEIKQFLAGTKEPETLDLIEKMAGNRSVIVKNHNAQMEDIGLHGYGYAEDSKKHLSSYEARCLKKSVLFIRDNDPALVETPPIAAIHPWRKQMGINPFFGKPFLKRIKLRIGNRKPPLLLRPFYILFGGWK